MDAFNAGYKVLFGVDNQEDNAKGEDEDITRPTGKDNSQGWLRTIRDVAKETGRSWDQVYELNVVEFLNTAAFIADEVRRHNIKVMNGKLG